MKIFQQPQIHVLCDVKWGRIAEKTDLTSMQISKHNCWELSFDLQTKQMGPFFGLCIWVTGLFLPSTLWDKGGKEKQESGHNTGWLSRTQNFSLTSESTVLATACRMRGLLHEPMSRMNCHSAMEGRKGQIGFRSRSSGSGFWETVAATAVEAPTAVGFGRPAAAHRGKPCQLRPGPAPDAQPVRSAPREESHSLSVPLFTGKSKMGTGGVGNNRLYPSLLKYISSASLFLSHACVHAESLQSCLTLCDSMDCRPPGSFVHGILQAGILGWAAVPTSPSSRLRDRTCVS